jgi:eukaryotic-like serine/threonine-protein kinase
MPIATHHIGFGPFELDSHSGELHKSGQKLKISGKPVQILTILLNQPGELISREELRKQLWPADTFVDFENGLNTAVKKLRQALGDDADAPRYIETLPRRGYRFVGQILSAETQTEVESPNAQAGKPSVPEPCRAPGPHNEAPVHGSTEKGKHRWWRFSAVRIGAAALIVAVSLSVAFNIGSLRDRVFRLINSASIRPRDPIVLADFVNTTGDSIFDDALKQGLLVQLSQSPFLNILPDYRVRTILVEMRHNPDDRLTPELAWEVCQRTASKAMLGGSIAKLGNHFVIGLNALNCASGESLARTQVEANGKEEVLRALGNAATELRKKLGESIRSIQQFNAPIEEGTTPSLEALKAFTKGVKAQSSQGDAVANTFFRRAVDLDPNFALGYFGLSFTYANLGEIKLASENARKAYDLRERVSEREKLLIAGYYHMNVTGALEKANQVLQLEVQIYPDEFRPHNALGVNHLSLGDYEKAAVHFRESLRLRPDHSYDYGNLAGALIALNRFDEAGSAVEAALAKKMESRGLHLTLYVLAFLQDDTGGMERELNWAASKPGAEDLMLAVHADAEAFHGHLNKARDFSWRAAESAQRNNQTENAALWQACAALRDAEVGEFVRARQHAAALAVAPRRDVKVLAALSLARAGDLRRAQALTDELAKDYPDNTMVNFYWLPTIRAAIEISRHDPAQAIEILRTTSHYELGTPAPFGDLRPVYLRGHAYLQLHDGPQAAVEFQKMLDHRGIVQNSTLGVLAHLGLARAYVLSGELPKARAKYQDFFALWKEADPDVPILRAAREEYEKLQ